MKLSILVPLLSAVAAAADGPTPDNVKALAREVARFQGCLLQRMWNDFKHVECGPCKDGDQGTSVAACVCRNKEQVERFARTDTSVCIDTKSPYSGIIREIAAGKYTSLLWAALPSSSPVPAGMRVLTLGFLDVAGLGIGALCGAYEGGGFQNAGQ